MKVKFRDIVLHFSFSRPRLAAAEGRENGKRVFQVGAADASAVPHRLGWRGRKPDGKQAFDEGHGFSRAEKDRPVDGFSH
jgi:hypothetical protein